MIARLLHEHFSTIRLVHFVLVSAGLGGGLGALAVRKGGTPHRVLGRIFFWGMMAGALTGFVLLSATAKDTLLFGVVLVLAPVTGYASLQRHRQGRHASVTAADRFVLVGLLLGCLGLGVWGARFLFGEPPKSGSFLAFGLFGTMLSIREFRRFSTKAPATWLSSHVLWMLFTLTLAVWQFSFVALTFLSPWTRVLPPILAGGATLAFWARRQNRAATGS